MWRIPCDDMSHELAAIHPDSKHSASTTLTKAPPPHAPDGLARVYRVSSPPLAFGVDCDRIGPISARGKIMNEGVLFVCECVCVRADSARGTCVMNLSGWTIVGWTGVLFQALWTARMTGMCGSYLTPHTHNPPPQRRHTHTHTHTHTHKRP